MRCSGGTKKESKYVMVKCQQVVKLYNEAMGGIYLLDQLISFYRTEMCSKKWTLRMIAHAFEYLCNDIITKDVFISFVILKQHEFK